MDGGSRAALEAATLEIIIDLEGLRLNPALRPLREGFEDTLLLLCATPLATVEELSCFGRVPNSTLRDRLARLTERELADSIPYRLGPLGPRPRRRYFPTEKGITASGAATEGQQHVLEAYPVSRQWIRLLGERLDAVAVLHHVAAMVADADRSGVPVRVDHYRHGPYDLLITLSGDRSIGLIRHGPALPTANLRYRLRSKERLGYSEEPLITLVLTHSSQAMRRAIRSLGDPEEHRTTLVACERELIIGGADAFAWQLCGSGRGIPVRIDPDINLKAIVKFADRLVDRSTSSRRKRRTLDPETLYSPDVRATMPEPTAQLRSALAAQLPFAEKDALDLISAWPLCTRRQLAGLMGGVTRHRVGQVLRSLMHRSLVRADGPHHVLTDRGLTYLARRDRAAVGPTLDRWSPEHQHPGAGNVPVYPGSSLRAIANQLSHQAGITDLAAALTAEVARSPDHELFDLQPTSRSSAGYRYDGKRYVIHPDASFLLEHRGESRTYFLEFERRATTPKRVPDRLQPYRRYFSSGWAERDHNGEAPIVLFVFESEDDEDVFLTAAADVPHAPFFSSSLEMIASRGVLGTSWRPPLPNPPDRLALASLAQFPKCPASPRPALPVGYKLMGGRFPRREVGSTRVLSASPVQMYRSQPQIPSCPFSVCYFERRGGAFVAKPLARAAVTKSEKPSLPSSAGVLDVSSAMLPGVGGAPRDWR